MKAKMNTGTKAVCDVCNGQITTKNGICIQCVNPVSSSGKPPRVFVTKPSAMKPMQGKFPPMGIDLQKIEISTQDGKFYIFYSEFAMKKAIKHVLGDTDNERGGVLIGQAYIEEIERFEFIVIEDIIEAQYAVSNYYKLEFNHKTWIQIDNERNRRFPDRQVVGWYHSHPGHGIMLSDPDIFIHESLFKESWQVALVLDTKKNRGGFFSWIGKGRILSEKDCKNFELDKFISNRSDIMALKGEDSSKLGIKIRETNDSTQHEDKALVHDEPEQSTAKQKISFYAFLSFGVTLNCLLFYLFLRKFQIPIHTLIDIIQKSSPFFLFNIAIIILIKGFFKNSIKNRLIDMASFSLIILALMLSSTITLLPVIDNKKKENIAKPSTNDTGAATAHIHLKPDILNRVDTSSPTLHKNLNNNNKQLAVAEDIISDENKTNVDTAEADKKGKDETPSTPQIKIEKVKLIKFTNIGEKKLQSKSSVSKGDIIKLSVELTDNSIEPISGLFKIGNITETLNLEDSLGNSATESNNPWQSEYEIKETDIAKEEPVVIIFTSGDNNTMTKETELMLSINQP